MEKVLKEVLSTIIKVKDEDGKFIPVFPVNTTEEVYVDIDNDVKLSTYLASNLSIKAVDTVELMYSLTPGDVNLLDVIKVVSDNKFFFVVDLNNLNSPEGYLEILTPQHIGGPGGIVTFDENGEVPIDFIDEPIEFITYTAADIN